MKLEDLLLDKGCCFPSFIGQKESVYFKKNLQVISSFDIIYHHYSANSYKVTRSAYSVWFWTGFLIFFSGLLRLVVGNQLNASLSTKHLFTSVVFVIKLL